MLPPVFETLTAGVAVTTIVGTRIYRHGRAPEHPTRPYVTWYLINSAAENNLSDVPETDRETIHVDCWHPEDRGVVDLATAVRDAIEPIAHCTGIPINAPEPETKLYRIGLQFDWFTSR